MNVRCPICNVGMYGGMTLVRHLYDRHDVNYQTGNDMVDRLYEKEARMYPLEVYKNGFIVMYEHLTADQCEALKEKVKDREAEYTWGTYGPKRDEELQRYSITQLSTQHLENLLITQPQISNELAAAILMLLKKRYGAI